MRRASPATKASDLPTTREDAGHETLTAQFDYPTAEIRLLSTTNTERRVRVRACPRGPWTSRWIEAKLDVLQVATAGRRAVDITNHYM